MSNKAKQAKSRLIKQRVRRAERRAAISQIAEGLMSEKSFIVDPGTLDFVGHTQTQPSPDFSCCDSLKPQEEALPVETGPNA